MILTCLLSYIVLFSPTLLINFNVVSTIFHYAGVFVIVVVSAIKSVHPFIPVSPASITVPGTSIIHSEASRLNKSVLMGDLQTLLGKFSCLEVKIWWRSSTLLAYVRIALR